MRILQGMVGSGKQIQQVRDPAGPGMRMHIGVAARLGA